VSASTIAEAVYDAICEEIRSEVCERIELPPSTLVVLPRRLRSPVNTNAKTQRMPHLARLPARAGASRG
jgi:hypothetical protein